MRQRSSIARAAAVVVAATWVLTAAGSPVQAAAPPTATNGAGDAAYYRSSVTSIQPPTPGVEVTVAPTTGAVTLLDRGGRTVLVLGYAGEPYLRFTRKGVDENTNSLTSTLAAGAHSVPPRLATAPERQPTRWRHRTSALSYTWHDLRVQWKLQQRPPIVASDPGHAHEVFRWALQFTVDDRKVLVLGAVRWIGKPGEPSGSSGLGWVGLGWVGLGWVGPGWVGPVVVLGGSLLIPLALLLRRRRRRIRSGAGRYAAGRSTAGPYAGGPPSAQETSAGETSAGETSAGETSAGETSAGEHGSRSPASGPLPDPQAAAPQFWKP